MTAEDFNAWLAGMFRGGLIQSELGAANLLGVTKNTLTKYKREGTDRKTALACRALYHKMDPWRLP